MVLLAGTVLAVLAVLTALGAWERRRHLRNLARIALRIHVNGMRGKSSTVRLIAAGLRSGGIRTLAKVSGTRAAVIDPDGTERPIERASPQPNVIEQTRAVAEAARRGARALVIECMAIQPVLQSLSELTMVRSTHGVITNVGPDHLEVMGPTEADAARALAGTVPVGGTLFTAEREHLSILAAAAADRGAELVAVGPELLAEVRPEELARFAHVEHAENVALALAVCRAAGVDRATALAGMWQARGDSGALTVHELDLDGRRAVFFNGFADNDPVSTRRVWLLANDGLPEADRRIALVNCRADRPVRSRQLGRAVAGWRGLDRCLVMGRGNAAFIRAPVRGGLPRRSVADLGEPSNEDILAAIAAEGGRLLLVVGIGNVGKGGAGGLAFVRFLRRGADDD